MPPATPNSIAERVRALGLALPEPRRPAANYVSASRAGGLLFVSGQIPVEDGRPAFLGRLGETVSDEEGERAARLCALGVLAQLAEAVGDDATRVRRVARLGVFIGAAPGFDRLSEVANGASDLVVAVFGEAGRHARTAVGVAALPKGVAVEVDAIIELAD
jgi:enamine deaminase RidA (YjgF/YER057c/UK114 family)